MEVREHEAEASTEKQNKFATICVFCGSRSGNRPSFSDAATELGKLLVDKKINLVYGGGSGGLMGLISQTVYDGGCHVLGIIPRALLPLEVKPKPKPLPLVYKLMPYEFLSPGLQISGEGVGEVKTVADMHERKSEMSKHSDAFIALPGGYGTMEELLEMIAWAQLGIHEKPVGLLNVDGYYDSLLALFDKGVEEGFIEATARHIVVSSDNAEELLKKMEVNLREKDDRKTSKKRKGNCSSVP